MGMSPGVAPPSLGEPALLGDAAPAAPPSLVELPPEALPAVAELPPVPAALLLLPALPDGVLVAVPRRQRASDSVPAAGQQRSAVPLASWPWGTQVSPLSQSASPFLSALQRSPSVCWEQAGIARPSSAEMQARTQAERSIRGMTGGVVTPNPGRLQPPGGSAAISGPNSLQPSPRCLSSLASTAAENNRTYETALEIENTSDA